MTMVNVEIVNKRTIWYKLIFLVKKKWFLKLLFRLNPSMPLSKLYQNNKEVGRVNLNDVY